MQREAVNGKHVLSFSGRKETWRVFSSVPSLPVFITTKFSSSLKKKKKVSMLKVSMR